MSSKKPKKRDIKHKDKKDDDAGGEGGKTGQIEFTDFLSSGASKRDDLLTADERKRLLGVHNGTHEGRVKKQKALRDNRKKLRQGKISKSEYRKGMSAAHSPYAAHPILSDKAQFSGIDQQINSLPTENIAETNKENRDKLENQYRLRHAPQNAPRFNPKPLPR